MDDATTLREEQIHRLNEAVERHRQRYGDDLRARLQAYREHLYEERQAEFERESSFESEEYLPRLENTVLLRNIEAPKVDWKLASKHVKCLKGRVVVEMAPVPKKHGVLHLPDRLAANLRPDVAVVIAKGDDVPLELGSVVIVRGYDGTWRINFKAGKYKAKGDVRCFGVFCWPGVKGKPLKVPFHESILAVLEDMKIKEMTGDNLLIRRDPVLEQEKGILLSRGSQFRNNAATVEKAGPDATLKPGTRIIYHPEGMLDIEIEGDQDLCILPEGSVEAILTENDVVTGIRSRSRAA